MKFNELRSKLADDLEIPNNTASNSFDMRISGNRRAIVENHLGITVYENDLVGIKTKEQTILMQGTNFKIEEINEYKIIIIGVIDDIKIISKE